MLRARWRTGDYGTTFPMRSILSILFGCCVGGLLAADGPATLAQSPSVPGPPVPFEHFGACPFEGCVYREWTASEAVTVLAERRPDSPVSYALRAGEKVQALTGVVVTVKAGKVQFREPRTISSSTADIHIRPGQTLYLLTYQGEGYITAWFDGRIYYDVDCVDFYNGVCDVDPGRCAGTIVEPSQTEWWVQIQNGAGRVGWTREPEKFDGKDALGR